MYLNTNIYLESLKGRNCQINEHRAYLNCYSIIEVTGNHKNIHY